MSTSECILYIALFVTFENLEWMKPSNENLSSTMKRDVIVYWYREKLAVQRDVSIALFIF